MTKDEEEAVKVAALIAVGAGFIAGAIFVIALVTYALGELPL